MTSTFLRKGLGPVTLVALALAIALGALVASAQPARAQTAMDTDADPTEVSPGDTVTLTFTSVGDKDRFRISEDSEGEASFVANGGENIRCGDYNDADPTTKAATEKYRVCDQSGTLGTVIIQVRIADDSPLGSVFVQNYDRPAGGADPTIDAADEIELLVVAANPPVAIKVTNKPAEAVAADGGATAITIELVDAKGKGLPDKDLLVTTTRGVLTAGTDYLATVAGETRSCGSISACTLTTTDDAVAEDTSNTAATIPAVAIGGIGVILTGNQGTGTATVTFHELNTGLKRSVNVVMHGAAASISAEVDESTVSVGSSTFIVVTVLDADGNPVVGNQTANFENHKPTEAAIVGPDVPAGQSATLLETDRTVYKDLAGTANDVPSCEAVTAVEADPDATPPVVGVRGSNGTNTAGKCVIQVTAAGGDTEDTADDSTRGTHSLTVGLTDNAKIAVVTVEVTVGGAPASISTDAPARVDALSATEITITVTDDAGERVGAVAYSVEQIEGEGRITAGTTVADNPETSDKNEASMTSDGRAKFTYRAPRSGVALFLITAGTAPNAIEQTVEIAVGEEPEPVVEPDPEPDPVISMQLRAGGFLYAVTAEGPATTARALFGDAVTIAWKYNADTGMWDVSYIPARTGSNFSINTGDILYVDSPIDQTVGG